MTIARTGRRSISAISVCATAMLAACGGSLTAPNTAFPAQNAATSWAHNDAGGCPLKRCIIVTSESGVYGKPLAAVLFFARDANGNATPVGEISGSKTMLKIPNALAMDSHNNLYVANWANSITVYAAGSEGNVAPIRTIEGAKTKLYRPTGIAIDSQDQIYVAGNQRNRINIYGAGANGNVAPIHEIRGKKTKLLDPYGLAFDSQSNLYVANDNPNTGWITVYSPNVNGDVAPARTIKGSATKLEGPTGLAVDASGYTYVVNSTSVNWEVSVFDPNANGNAVPVSYFSGGYGAFGVTLGNHDIYVSSVGYDDLPFVAAFGGGPVGNQGHALRKIQGEKTKLIWPEGVLVR
jgi:hypothetical protein